MLLFYFLKNHTASLRSGTIGTILASLKEASEQSSNNSAFSNT